MSEGEIIAVFVMTAIAGFMPGFLVGCDFGKWKMKKEAKRRGLMEWVINEETGDTELKWK